jgi:hypothetical protein
MMSLQASGSNQRPHCPQISVAAAYKTDDQALSIGKTSNFSGANQPPTNFIPVYTFLVRLKTKTKNPLTH